MVMQKTKSSVSIAGGLKAHAAKPVDYGTDFSDPPGGISNGRACLVQIQRGTYKTGKNQGKPFIQMAGIIVEPATAIKTVKAWDNGKVKVLSATEVSCDGLRTSQIFPCCATTNSAGKTTSAAENMERAANAIKQLGGQNCLDGVETDEDLDELFKQMLDPDNPIYFRFSTQDKDPTAEYPDSSGVWQRWYGTKGLEDYVPPGDANGHVSDATDPATGGPAEEPGNEEPGVEEPPATGPDVDADGALAELAAKADAGDQDASARMAEMATEAGVTDAEWDAAANHEEILALILERQGGGEPAAEPEPEPEPEPAKPAKGEVWIMQRFEKGKPVMVPKSKPPRQATVKVEIMAVNLAKGMADCKSNVDKKTVWKAVPFAHLSQG